MSENESVIKLHRLQQVAKRASIYHRNELRFKRNPNITHVVHSSLHCLQSVIALSIEIFHYVHHQINRRNREIDSNVPSLPEERNPIFFIYPVCMAISAICAILWIFNKILHRRPQLAMAGCFIAAFLTLLAGIMEMKHADMYIDLNLITDDDLISHPVFVHNFVMCMLSIFCMTIYLIQAWILYDHWVWIRQPESSDDEDENDESSSTETEFKFSEQEEPGVLNPIPTLDMFKDETLHSDDEDIEKEPIILYCCFVDWYVHVKRKITEHNPTNEFQVIHVM